MSLCLRSEEDKRTFLAIFGLAVRKAPPTKSFHAETPWKKVANSTAHLDAMSVVHQAVEDAVGDSGISDLLVPARDWQLGK